MDGDAAAAGERCLCRPAQLADPVSWVSTRIDTVASLKGPLRARGHARSAPNGHISTARAAGSDLGRIELRRLRTSQVECRE
jgi:hypothetical protein